MCGFHAERDDIYEEKNYKKNLPIISFQHNF